MTYDIELIHYMDGRAEALTLEVISLVGGGLAAAIEQARELYRNLNAVPRPDGYRIRENGDSIVHEFHKFAEREKDLQAPWG